MRRLLLALAVLGLVGASACSSNKGTTMLAAGAVCSSNAACQSAACGINGNGHCCSAACSAGDSTCGATACDATGSCTYSPSGTACADSCAGGMLAPGACTGSGACAHGTPAACPNDFACNSAGTGCLTQCTSNADCVTGLACDTATNQCKPPQMTGACTSNAACTSGFCGSSGTGNCCTAQCVAAADPACNAACDATGACVYPRGSTCGTSSCTGSTLSAGTCDATGVCNPGTAGCPKNLICNSAGTACLTQCASGADCVTGFVCDAATNLCKAPRMNGACTSNAACISGICGARGSGNCCTAACSTTDLTCGASDCDATSGTCVYPSAATSCGAGASCAGTIATGPTDCDGAGACSPPTVVSCTPYLCGLSACLTSCSDNSSCVIGAFCETAHSDCCVLQAGSTLAVDAAIGNDNTGCCGVGTHTPCQTLTHAMALIANAQASGITITATVDGGGGDWDPAAEVYPILLGWNVELNAPGVFFVDPTSVLGVSFNQSIFYVAILGPGDADSASLFGTAASPISVGMNSTNLTADDQTDDVSAIAVETGATLYLANATLNGSFYNTDNRQSILVNAGATLIVGQDRSTTVSGTVTIGNALGVASTDGFQGIVCATQSPNQGCTIQDVPLVKQSSIVIQGQEGLDLDAEDFANVNLSSAPVFGIPPTAVGFSNENGVGCATKLDENGFTQTGLAVLLNGAVTMALSGATVQCVGGTAFLLQSTANGSPKLTIDSSTIQNTDLGIDAQAGKATVTHTTFRYNYLGVFQEPDPIAIGYGTIDLSGGGNTLICNSYVESSTSNLAPGIGAYNLSPFNLAADNVTWDTSAPDTFTCDTYFNCTCNLTTCTNTAGNDGMDAVEDSVYLGSITTTGNGLAATTCN